METGVVRLRRRRVDTSQEVHLGLESIKEEDTMSEENPISNGIIDPEEESLDPERLEKNLEQVRLHTEKMQRAHEVFIRRQQTLEEKGPVRQRLGVVRVRRMGPRPAPKPTATTSNGVQRQSVKRRLYNSGASVVNGGTTRRRFGLKRLHDQRYHINLAQNRMQRVRAQIVNNTCPVRLRRNHPSARLGLPRNANNLTIQVPNFAPSTNGQTYPHNIERFRLTLNPEIQALIRNLQIEASDPVRQFFPINRVTPQVTSIFLSTRFSGLT
ncbi:unnamed protein product [Ceutorhynchus assimilis]|uniref:Uncharacterized protein n=1 Tax=Ceutorhynchus assimilis TaxID=467358 RepID=A0A9P0DEW7_9CUCU|nr:unnamed protein product [Ceutorhynchus assimilis]